MITNILVLYITRETKSLTTGLMASLIRSGWQQVFTARTKDYAH